MAESVRLMKRIRDAERANYVRPLADVVKKYNLVESDRAARWGAFKTPLISVFKKDKMEFKDDMDIVFVFSGGALKGAVYLGFFAEMEKIGLYPDFVIGTSAGGLAAIGLATGKDAAGIEAGFGKPQAEKIAGNMFKYGWNLLKSGFKGFVDSETLAEVVSKMLPPGITECGQLEGFAVTSVMRENSGLALAGNVYGMGLSPWLPIATAGAMTAAIPGAFTPVEISNLDMTFLDDIVKGRIATMGEDFAATLNTQHIEDGRMFDGGVRANAPIGCAHALLRENKKNAIIVAVNLGYTGVFERKGFKDNNFVKYLIDAFEIAAFHQLPDEIISTGFPLMVLNANYDGKLSNIALSDTGQWDFLKGRGAQLGRALAVELGMYKP